MPLNLGDTFPNFTVETTEGTIKFHDFLGDRYDHCGARGNEIANCERGLLNRNKNSYSIFVCLMQRAQLKLYISVLVFFFVCFVLFVFFFGWMQNL